MPLLDQRLHVSEEEGEQQNLNVRAVDVGICHDDDFAVAQLFHIEAVADAAAECLNNRNQRLVAVNLVNAAFFDVKHFTAKRQNRLIAAVSAVFCRAARGISLDEVKFGERDVSLLAVREFAGQGHAVERTLAAGIFTRLACRLTRNRGGNRLFENRFGLGRVFLEVFLEFFGHDGRNQRPHVRVAELCLGLALKLRVGQFDADNRAKTLEHVVLREVGVGILQKVILARILVYTAKQCRAKALLMRTAVNRRHVVGEGDDRCAVAVVVLHRDLGNRVVLLPLHIDDVGRERGASRVEIFNIADDAALIAEVVLGDRVGTQIAQHDAHARVEKRLLAHTVEQNLIFELGRIGENRRVGLETDVNAVSARRVFLLEKGARDLAALKALGAVLRTVVVVDFKPLGQRIDDRCADAVQTARNLIAAAAELTARVQQRIDDLKRRNPLRRVNAARNAATVVLDRNTAVGMDFDRDFVAHTGERFVNRVVHNLVNKMVKSLFRSRADVHTGTLADCLQSLKHLYLTVLVRALILCHVGFLSGDFIENLF